MEKKLTDEEIVKAWDICNNTPCCTNECPYFNKNGRDFCMEDKALYKDLKDLIHRQKEKIERLMEEVKQYESISQSYIEVCDINAELQKKVDDLTDKLGKVLSGIKADELLVARGVEQAVKDTAKEILQGLIDKAYVNECIDLTIKEVKAWFREDYGVEVE